MTNLGNLTIAAHPPLTLDGETLETLWGFTREDASKAQECLFNESEHPLTIVIPPNTGIFVRQKENAK